jgi:lipopolysaccharide transport system ATP-binding protein
LGKQYRIGSGGGRSSYKSVRDVITQTALAPMRRLKNIVRGDGSHHSGSEHFWALKDVSFEVKHGEVLGVIGRNGAGKSTLLKVLTRITEPTEGEVRIRGRVGSLLEVGTGFHPELTGRENVYLNGAILGMHRREIASKFDEIVAFAEVEKFIDTPVKRYSSGMYLRLAFSVAAHLEPEILLVDEVLAVGDAAFQKKCLGKMGDVAQQGRTVLFVSHDMGAINNLCDRGLLLDSGHVLLDSTANATVTEYVTTVRNALVTTAIRDRVDRKGNGVIRLTGFTINTESQIDTDTIYSGDDVELVLSYEVPDNRQLKNVSISIPFYNHMGQHIFMCWTRMLDNDYEEVPAKGQFIAKIPRIVLSEGNYYVNLWCEVNGQIADWITEAARVNVLNGDFFGTGRSLPISHGGVFVDHSWGIR